MIENEGSTDDYDEVATDNVSTKHIEGNGNNGDDTDASKCSESKRIPSTTNITNIVRENVDRSTIIDKGSTNDYDEVATDNVSTKHIEGNGNNRDGVDDDSSSIDPEMYTVASNKSTPSIDNALSLLHKLHSEKKIQTTKIILIVLQIQTTMKTFHKTTILPLRRLQIVKKIWKKMEVM